MQVERRSFLVSLWAGLSALLFGKRTDNYSTLRAVMEEPLAIESYLPGGTYSMPCDGGLEPGDHVALDSSTGKAIKWYSTARSIGKALTACPSVFHPKLVYVRMWDALPANAYGRATEDSTPIYSADGKRLIGHHVTVELIR
jgi:hypothetical protein